MPITPGITTSTAPGDHGCVRMRIYIYMCVCVSVLGSDYLSVSKNIGEKNGV